MTLLEMIDVGGWLDEVDLRAFDDPESNKEMARTFAALDYARTKMAADFDASGAWASSGAKTAAAWLSTTNRTPLNESRGLVRRGRRLRHLPYFEEAWAAGLITAAHIDVVARVRRPATEWALARDEPLLVEQAKTLQFRDFVRVIAYWELHADPIGAEEAAERAIDGRDVYLTPSLGGIFLGRITLDPISGAQVHGELARIVNELYQADHTEAADRLGRSPKVDELRRTNRQRWADALVEMAVRSGTAPANGRRPEPLFSVLVNHEALIGPMCQMAQSGIVLPPGSLLRWLEQADFERAVFLPDNRVEVSETSRFFTGALRHALELRDLECAHPYCDMAVDRCQADHIIEWHLGGLTNQKNGRMLCAFHNRLRNQRPPPPEE
jgi:hypothetical protein